MTVRDVQVDFGFQPRTATTVEIAASSIVGPAGTYIAPNTYDAGPFGAYLTVFSPMDTILSVGGQNLFVESGAGFGMKLVVDWVSAPAGNGTIQTQLITTPSSVLNNPPFAVMIDFGAQPVAAFTAGTRQIMTLPRSNQWQRYLSLQIITSATLVAGSYVAWLGLDVDSEVLGYADGFSIK